MMYISKTEEHPNYLKNDFYCYKYDTAICSIPGDNVTTGDVFYISVVCYHECSY